MTYREPQPISLMRRLWKRLGLGRAMLALTVVSIAVSLIITIAVDLAADGSITVEVLVIAALVPAVVAPTFSYLFLSVVGELEEAEARMRELAMRDDLTGAFNRRHFLSQAELEIKRARRYGTVFSIVLFDLDNFKQVNDTYGHAAGDHVLRAVSGLCEGAKRGIDTFARYGGEEFVLLLPETDSLRAFQFAERLRQLLSSSATEYHGTVIRVTASFGVKTWDAGSKGLDDMLTAVDQAVYAGKGTGKDRVVSAS